MATPVRGMLKATAMIITTPRAPPRYVYQGASPKESRSPHPWRTASRVPKMTAVPTTCTTRAASISPIILPRTELRVPWTAMNAPAMAATRSARSDLLNLNLLAGLWLMQVLFYCNLGVIKYTALEKSD